jgi:hypothetical protein
MDPNANLQEQEAILARWRTPRGCIGRDNTRLAELRIALAEWLQAGGFAPDWSKAPKAAHYFINDHDSARRIRRKATIGVDWSKR